MTDAMAGVYALWLVAGTLDFHLHRRSNIAQTSGLPESTLHGLQLLLIGIAVVGWLALAATYALVALLLPMAALHATLGYLDTASADGRRRITPLEQHVHSILDIAPWAFLAWVAWQARADWRLLWQPAQSAIWWIVLVPSVLLAVVPWLLELRRCLRARASAERR